MVISYRLLMILFLSGHRKILVEDGGVGKWQRLQKTSALHFEHKLLRQSQSRNISNDTQTSDSKSWPNNQWREPPAGDRGKTVHFFFFIQVSEIIKVKLILKRVIKLINSHVKGPFIRWINWNRSPGRSWKASTFYWGTSLKCGWVGTNYKGGWLEDG